MNPSRTKRSFLPLFALLLAGGCAGCATTGPNAATESQAAAWPVSEAAAVAADQEQRHLFAVLRRLSQAGHAYERMTEARSTLLDAVSWWGAFGGSLAPAATATEAPESPTCAGPPSDDELDIYAEPAIDIYVEPATELESEPAESCTAAPPAP